MRFFHYLFAATAAVLILATVAWLGSVAYFLYLAATAPSHSERIAAQQAEKLRTKAEDWEIFCAQYDCNDIPLGHIVKSIGQETLSLIHTAQPFTGRTCRLATDSYDETEYVDGKVLRGAALGHVENPYFVQCAEPTRPFTEWEDHMRVYKGAFRAEEPGRNNIYREILGPSQSGTTSPKPTYASRFDLLRPASQDFDLFDPDALESQSRVYVSKTRMFQGRHVVLICADRCDMQTISFAEDESLTSLHFAELIQFDLHEWQCDLFTALWECGPPMPEHLASMANYIRFLDQAVEKARRRPLAMLR